MVVSLRSAERWQLGMGAASDGVLSILYLLLAGFKGPACFEKDSADFSDDRPVFAKGIDAGLEQ